MTCEPGNVPKGFGPVPAFFGIHVVVDDALKDDEFVLVGASEALVRDLKGNLFGIDMDALKMRLSREGFLSPLTAQNHEKVIRVSPKVYKKLKEKETRNDP